MLRQTIILSISGILGLCLLACSAREPDSSPEHQLLVDAYHTVWGQAEPGENDYQAASRLAESGNLDASYVAGFELYVGREVPQNYRRAVEFLDAVASARDHPLKIEAASLIARVYDEGFLADENSAMAIRYYEIMATSGDVDGMISAASLLGPRGREYSLRARERRRDDIFERSNSFSNEQYLSYVDESEGAQWPGLSYPNYSDACVDRTIRPSPEEMLRALESDGSQNRQEPEVDEWTAIDLIRAHAWFNVAATLGDRRGRMARDELERYCMTTDEIESAQELSATLFSHLPEGVSER